MKVASTTSLEAARRFKLPNARTCGLGAVNSLVGASMSDVMSVRLHLSGVHVLGVLVDSVDRLEVAVESALEWVPVLWVPLPQGVGTVRSVISRPTSSSRAG